MVSSDAEEPGNALLKTAQRDGLLALPWLLAVEACALGAYRYGVFETAVLAAWADLTPPTRKTYGAAAIRGLAQRGLLTRDEPDEDASVPATDESGALVRLATELAAIVAARSSPTWIAVCVLEGTEQTGPRVYGLGDVGQPLRAAVVELPFGPDEAPGSGPLGGAYRYLLASSPRASELITRWVRQPRSAAGPGRAVDLYRRCAAPRPLVRGRIGADALSSIDIHRFLSSDKG